MSLYSDESNSFFSNTSEKFYPQMSVEIFLQNEGKGNRFVSRCEFKDESKKAYLSTKRTFRKSKQEEVFRKLVLSSLEQLQRLKKEKIEIKVDSVHWLYRLRDDFERGKSSNSEWHDCIQILKELRFFKFSSMEG